MANKIVSIFGIPVKMVDQGDGTYAIQLAAAGGGGSAPVSTISPAITGTAKVRQRLTCSTGTWDGSPTSYAYQWKRGGVEISGATNNTYDTLVVDTGTAFTCEVVATNAFGDSDPAVSNTVNIEALLLDQLAGSTLVVSMRQLRKAYAGNCVELRRSSDDVELAFGFTAAGLLDTAAIETWLGGADAYIKTWYDQSAAGSNNITQATSTLQPKLIINAINGYAVVRMEATDRMTYASSILASGMTIALVCKLTDQAANYVLLAETATVDERMLVGATTTQYSIYRRKAATNLGGNQRVNTDTGYHRLRMVAETTADLYQDDVLAAAQAAAITAASTSGRILGANTDNGNPFKGDYAELIAFNSALDATNQGVVDDDQNATFF